MNSPTSAIERSIYRAARNFAKRHSVRQRVAMQRWPAMMITLADAAATL
jgi:hypothetical protein